MTASSSGASETRPRLRQRRTTKRITFPRSSLLVWRHCDGRRTVDDVLRVAALSIAPAPSRADVERTLRELRDVDLVRDESPAKPYNDAC
ncbi:MAG: PqqD family protein [Polyangiaceae bacterium]